MFKNLRVLFCILSVACVAATIFIFVYYLWWGFVPLGGALAFAGLMFLFKGMQERADKAATPPPPTGDFITGKVENKDSDEQ